MVATSLSALPTNPAATTCPGCVVSGITTSTSHTLPNPFPIQGTTATLAPNTVYYWQVQGYNDTTSPTTQGAYSSQWSFTTPPPTVSDLSFTVTTASPTSAQKIQIPATAGQAWTLKSNVSWITFDISSGVGPATVTATVNATSFPAGTYNAVLTLTIDGVSTRSTVTLTVKKVVTVNPTLTISPLTVPLGSSFTLNGAGFSPDSTISLNASRADGTAVPAVKKNSDSNGSFSFVITSQATDPVGAWSYQATDDSTGQQSQVIQVQYTVSTPPAGTDDLSFSAASVDVTVPDNTPFAPGAAFSKVWYIQNSGTNTWTNYRLVALSGTVNGHESINLSSQSFLTLPTTASGQWTQTPPLPMTARSTPGTYYSYWEMRNSSGLAFGSKLYVKIQVTSQQPVSTAQGALTGGQGTGDAPASKSGSNGDPVNTALGAYTYQRTDLTVPGHGIDLVFSRTYNSNDTTLGPLGFGWSHSFNIYLVNISVSSLSVHYSDGKVLDYDNQFGTFQSRYPGYYDLLTQNPDSTWTLQKPDQRKYQFNFSGKLTAIQDKNGNQVSLTYDGSGKLTQVTDTVGRVFNFTYSNSLVTSVSDPGGRTLQFGYDGSSNLTTFRDPNNNLFSYSYDSSHRITRIIDGRGNNLLLNTYDGTGRVIAQSNGRGYTWQFSYDTVNKITTITDPAGKEETHLHDTNFDLQRSTNRLNNAANILYDQNNNRTQISDPKGNYLSYQYDPRGNVTIRTDPLQNSRQLAYDGRNNPTQIVDELGNPTLMAYDTTGNVTTVTDALNNASAITYNSYGQPLTVKDPNGNTTTYSYDAQGNIASVKDALNNTTTFTYDSIGRRTRVTDARGKTTSYSYDANSNVLTVTDPLSNVTTYTYDGNNNQVSVRDPRGNTTTYAYNENNLLTKQTDPLGNYLAYTYDSLDRRITSRDKRGNTTQYGYDAEGRVTSVTDPLGNVTTYAYDANGNRTTVTDAKGQTTTFAYNALNRVTKIADPLGNTIQKEYDAASRLSKETDPRGNATQYAYDQVGNLTQVTDATGGTAKYTYDKNRNRISQTDPNGNTSNFSYDTLNRLLTSKDPLNNSYSYTYDSVGNRISQTDAKGQTINFYYDDANSLTKITYPDASTVQFTYDPNGNVTRMVDSLGTNTYSYDVLNRLTSYQDPFGKTIGYQYDENGNITRLTYPDGKQVSYQYDKNNRMTSLSDWVGKATTYQYDSTNLLTKMAHPNGTTASYTYDNAGRLTGLVNAKSDSTVINSYQFTLDRFGNRIAATIQEPLLTRIPSSSQTYSYDAANRIQTAGNAAFTFDANGNMTSQTQSGVTTSYTYDFNDRLIKVGTISQYFYNGRGTRLQKIQSSVTTRYVVDINHDLSQLLCQTNGSGTITDYFVYGNGLAYHVAPDGTHLYYHFDAIGSTVAATDDRQVIVNSYAYDPAGANNKSSETVSQPFRYIGQYGVTQEINGLIFMRARYYAPELGRFITKDQHSEPLPNTQDLNLYTYAKNNPVLLIDVNGEFAWSTAFTAAGQLSQGLLHIGYGLGQAGLSGLEGAIQWQLGRPVSGSINIASGFFSGIDEASKAQPLVDAFWTNIFGAFRDQPAVQAKAAVESPIYSIPGVKAFSTIVKATDTFITLGSLFSDKAFKEMGAINLLLKDDKGLRFANTFNFYYSRLKNPYDLFKLFEELGLASGTATRKASLGEGK
jgi:RHS repeat-associated protein